MSETRTKLSIQENIPLAPLVTLKVGGAARFFVRAETENQLLEAAGFARENDLKLFVLGGGSNVVIADAGFDGLVVQVALKGIEINKNKVVTQAGEDWDEFVSLCVEKNLQGVECLSGIPGLIGGAPVQNVGAYGQEVSETIESVRVYDTKSAQILEIGNRECRFAYRKSLFNTTERKRFVVLAVTWTLAENAAPKIVYKDLQQIFEGKTPTLAETREAVLKIRRAKSMVIDANDPNSKSVGSFFKNPLVTVQEFDAIRRAVQTRGIENAPSFPADDGQIKIPAAWLIENSGFYKGYRLGNAAISTNHALAIVNAGDARATDIIALKDEIQTKVEKTFGVKLQPEPEFIGFD